MTDIEVEEAAGGIAGGYHFCSEGAAFDFGSGERILFAPGGERKGLGAEVGPGGALRGSGDFIGLKGEDLALAGNDVLDFERRDFDGCLAVVLDDDEDRENFELIGVELAEGLGGFVGCVEGFDADDDLIEGDL